MLASYATGIGALVIVLVAWVGIQIAWRKVFPGVCTDPDVLAERTGCQRSACSGACESSFTDCDR